MINDGLQWDHDRCSSRICDLRNLSTAARAVDGIKSGHSARTSLFDHFVAARQGMIQVSSGKGLCGFESDDEFKFSRLLDRKICGLARANWSALVIVGS